MMRVSFKIIGMSAMVFALAFSGCKDKNPSPKVTLSPKVTKDAKFALGVNLDKQQAFKVVDAYLDQVCNILQLDGKKTAEAKEKVAQYKNDLFTDAPRDVREFIDESGLGDAALRWAVISAEDFKIVKGVPQCRGLSLAIAGKVNLEKLLPAIEKKSSEKARDAVSFKELSVEGAKTWRMEPKDDSAARQLKDLDIDLHITSLDGLLVLVASSRVTLEKQIRLYRDGKDEGNALGGFSAKEGDLLLLTVNDIGGMVRQNLSKRDLRGVAETMPDGDEVVMGLKTLQVDIAVASNGTLSETVSLKAASEKDADKIRTLAKSGLMMARAKMGEDPDTPKFMKKWFEELRIEGMNGEIQVRGSNLLLGFTMGALFPMVSSSMLSANLSTMALQGRKLIMGMIQENIVRMGNRGPVWPRTVVNGESSEDVASRAYTSATEYFSALFDMARYGSAKWDPCLEGDLISSLWGCGVPAMSGKRLESQNVAWIVAANVTDETPDFVPVLISANFNPTLLLRKWDGHTDASVRLPIGPASGAEAFPFGDKGIVIVRKSGAAETIKAKHLTYGNLYGHAFDLTNMDPPLLYLTPTGVKAPVGHE